MLENETVAVFYYDESLKKWVKIGGKVLGDLIYVEVDHFTKFAVFKESLPDPGQPAEPDIELKDIAGHQAEINIRQGVVARGIVNGYPDATSQPNQQVTREEFVVMLIKGLKLQAKEANLSFTDSTKIGSSWARPAVEQAIQEGIISGYSDNTFRPQAVITRVEMVARVLRLTLEGSMD